MLCGLPAALSAIRSDALRVPVADGVNVPCSRAVTACSEQLPERQVVELTAKSAAFAPVTDTPLTDSGAVAGVRHRDGPGGCGGVRIVLGNVTPAAAVGFVAVTAVSGGPHAHRLVCELQPLDPPEDVATVAPHRLVERPPAATPRR